VLWLLFVLALYNGDGSSVWPGVPHLTSRSPGGDLLSAAPLEAMAQGQGASNWILISDSRLCPYFIF